MAKLKGQGMQINAQLQEELKTLTSVLSSRYSMATALGLTHDGNRDIYKSCGYKKDLTFEDYYLHYKRSNIAGTIVDLMPEECFGQFPTIKENSDTEDSVFEKQFKDIEAQVSLFSNLMKADKFSGIHKYSVLLLGVDDGKKLSEQVIAARSLVYITPYLEKNVNIISYENDTNNERYGLPTEYEVTQSAEVKGTSATSKIKVHWSRIIHVAENTVEKAYLGTPRLERVYNNIENIVKISGAGGEGYWRGAFPGLGLVMDKDAKISTAQSSDMKDEIDDYTNGISRILKLKGVEPKTITARPASPVAAVDTELKLISFTLHIPKRILEGSERGELSSGQDKDMFDDKISSRRTQYVGPHIIRPLVNRLQEFGILDKVQYTIEWDEFNEVSAKEQATNNKIKAETLTIYAKSPEAQEIIPPEHFLKEFLGMSDEKLETILDAASKVQNDEADEIKSDVKMVEEEL